MHEPIPEGPSAGMHCPPDELDAMLDAYYALRGLGRGRRADAGAASPTSGCRPSVGARREAEPPAEAPSSGWGRR